MLGGSGDSGLIKAAVRPSPYLEKGSPIVLKPLKSHLIEFFSSKMYKLRDFCFQFSSASMVFKFPNP